MLKASNPARSYDIDRNTGGVSCGTASDPNCPDAHFATARISGFHTERLQQATAQINGVLHEALSDPDRNGRSLDVLITTRGLLLAWTNHNIVTAYDDDATIAEALGLTEIAAHSTT